MKNLITAILFLFLWSCSSGSDYSSGSKSGSYSKGLSLSPSSFSELEHWDNVSHHDSFIAFKKTCPSIARRIKGKKIAAHRAFGTASEWKKLCEEQKKYTPSQAKQFFETHFTPMKIHTSDSKFTGYYEPILYGSFTKRGAYQYPIYPVPKGMRKPYYSRAQIANGILSRKVKPLLWVTSEVDSFFLHIQGSGRVLLPGNQVKRLAYAGQNGHKYYAIGKYLIDSGEIPRSKMSALAIKKWLKDNPRRAQAVMNKNPSYVFFNLEDIKHDDYAKGAAGVPLTPEYSMAVDRHIYPYGVPLWVETSVKVPNDDRPNIPPFMAFHRLMIAQDTGGAIKGGIRGDVFFGAGSHAEYMASNLSASGEKYLFVPK